MSQAKSRAGIDELLAFRMNSTYPFDCTADDLSHTSLEEAHAMTIVLHRAIDEATEEGTDSTSIRPVHISRALEGIGKLIALSAFAREQAVQS